MVSVSLCMIVKNEEDVLGRCLESVSGLVDEIVIVDTGSTDRTQDIAARFTDKIFPFPWRDDRRGGFVSPDCYGYLPCIQQFKQNKNLAQVSFLAPQFTASEQAAYRLLRLFLELGAGRNCLPLIGGNHLALRLPM